MTTTGSATRAPASRARPVHSHVTDTFPTQAENCTMPKSNGGRTAVTTDTGAQLPPAVDAAADDHEPGNGSTPDGMKITGESVGDIFDNLESLRIKQDFGRPQIRRPFTSCSIRKPRKHEWFQAHPDPA